MTSGWGRRRSNSLSGDFEETNGTKADSGAEPETEELDWDGYSSTLEHRLAGVGNKCYIYSSFSLFRAVVA